MNKKLITAILATITLTTTAIQAVPAKADNAPAVAILDTAIDTSLPIFKDRIVYEVCVLEWNSCPNGKSFQEGPGSAVLPMPIIANNGFSHGTSMASVVANTDPNVKIVFVRIIGNTPSGGRQIANELTVVNALTWVLQNKDKFNIKAVSMSQGHHNLSPLTDYCPSTPNTVNLIKNLNTANVGVFFAAGNGYDYKRLDWPACINESISVGATDARDTIPLYSNMDSARLDIHSLGTMKVSLPGGTTTNGVGSSVSTQVAATQWVVLSTAKPTLTADQLLDLIKKTATSTRGSAGRTGLLFNLAKALNG